MLKAQHHNKNMKLPRKKRSEAPLILAIAVPVVIAGGAVVYMLGNQPKQHSQTTARPVNSVDYGPPTDQEKQETTQSKADIIQQNDTKTQPSTPPEASKKLTINISRASQLGKGQPVNIRTFVDGATTGTCDVTLTQAGKPTVTATFIIAFEATSSTCNGDVAAAQIGTSGDWQLSIVAKSANLTSTAATQTIKVDI